jgi:3,4-dihydroxy 2-butanone 4-phosphate synthase/GTP cyclohydrolase II
LDTKESKILHKEAIERVNTAIQTVREGKMVIMIDDEDRENEGDLVYAAAMSTPEMVNFMAMEARGLICVALEGQAAKRLDLNPMVSSNTANHETAFTVSVDATEATTGISAAERDLTIRLLADPLSRPGDLVRPGHIFPLTAKPGGVLVRTGHTEGSVDLCRLAGLAPAGVICEVIKDDGTMARRDDLDLFSKKHDIPIVFIADLIAFRLMRESLVSDAGTQPGHFMGVPTQITLWRDHMDRIHRALLFGPKRSECAVKFHTIGSDAAFLLNATKYEGMRKAVDYLQQNGGVLVLMDDHTYHAEEAIKEFGIGAQILKALGIERLTLLATRHVNEPVALSGFGLEIVREEVLS